MIAISKGGEKGVFVKKVFSMYVDGYILRVFVDWLIFVVSGCVLQQKKTSTSREENPKVTTEEKKTGGKEEESDGSSEADNMPLSSLRERPVTPG